MAREVWHLPTPFPSTPVILVQWGHLGRKRAPVGSGRLRRLHLELWGEVWTGCETRGPWRLIEHKPALGDIGVDGWKVWDARK